MAPTRILDIPDYKILFIGRVFATMSLQAQAVIVGWYVYELTHDPLMLGLIGLAEAVPAIGFAFLAGHTVDTLKPAQVYRTSVLVLTLNALVILAISLPALPISSVTRLLVLFSAVFVSGMMRSFTSPSVFSLIAHIVPRHLMVVASAWNSWAFQMAAISGPAIGGLIYGAIGSTWAFAFPPLLMSAAWLTLPFFSHSTVHMQSQSVREPFLVSIHKGIRFALGQRVLISAMTLDMLSVLFGGAVAILPMFSDQILHAGSMGLGILRAAPAVGSAAVALVMTRRPMRTISGKMLLFCVAGFGLSNIGFAYSSSFSLAFFFLVLSGAFDGVSMVIRNTILQLLTPQEMRGRISSLSLIFVTSSNEIGAFESGLAARALGLIPSLIFGGSVTLVVVAMTAWLSPDLAKTRIQPGHPT